MITIPTLTRLLAINIVARRRLGVSSKLIIRLCELVFELRISLSCEGDSEKNAVSEPDAAAEHNNKSKTAAIPASNPAEDASSVMLNAKTIKAVNASGSGSATV